jgi:predicted TIM-barrel fold metal-dependent hydrolase
MRKADVHCHLWQGDDAVERLLSECEKHEIEKVFLSSTGRQHRQVSNPQVLEAAGKYPDLILPVAWVHLDRESDLHVERYAGEGFRGLKVIDPRLPYNHANYLPAYRAAAKHNMPVLFHCGIKARVRDAVPGMNENHRPIWLDDIARRYPGLRLVLAHIGTPWHEEAFMVARLNPNVFLELTSGSGWEIKGLDGGFFRQKLWWKDAWKKVLFGTDVPPERTGWAVEVYEGLLDGAGLDGPAKEDIYYNNFMSLLEE